LSECRFCGKELHKEFIDLVSSPPSNSFLSAKELDEPEVYYPLKLYVCDSCFLVQIGEYKKSGEIFSGEYVYFSSYSKSWLEHAKKYVDMAISRFGICASSLVVEIASNDGYLLQYFKERVVPCLGIEPSGSTAAVAREKGIDVIEEFFGVSLATEMAQNGKKADLLLGNNVLAHVPDINDFVAGLKILLKDNGVITMEFPHLLNLVEQNQFDTIYHEHFSYLSFYTVKQVFEKHNLKIFDIEELSTHGGSLRIYATHVERDIAIEPDVDKLMDKEIERGITDFGFYTSFQDRADKVKYDFLKFLIEQKINGKKVVAYGAAAKGNTLLNYAGIKKDLISFAVDASPHKIGKFLPGSHIMVVGEDKIQSERPDFVVILPWNIIDEITMQLSYAREWGAKFVTAVPKLEIF